MNVSICSAAQWLLEFSAQLVHKSSSSKQSYRAEENERKGRPWKQSRRRRKVPGQTLIHLIQVHLISWLRDSVAWKALVEGGGARTGRKTAAASKRKAENRNGNRRRSFQAGQSRASQRQEQSGLGTSAGPEAVPANWVTTVNICNDPYSDLFVF